MIDPGSALKRGCFLLTGCGFAAFYSPIFLGGNFGALFDAALHSPLTFGAPFSFYLWVGLAGLAGRWFYQGQTRLPSFIDPDTTTVGWGCAGVLISVLALFNDWVLPIAAWGRFLNYASAGFWFAYGARGFAGIWLGFHGYRSAEAPSSCGHGPQLREYSDVIRGLLAENQSLKSECEQQRQTMGALVDEAENTASTMRRYKLILKMSVVRRAALGALHPDKAPREEDRLSYTEWFKAADKIFKDIASEKG